MLITKDFYLLRTPLLPLHFLKQFDEMTLSQLGMRLKTVFADPLLQEAIYIASPDLYQELQKWLQGSIMDEKGANKLVLSLFRYLLRMSSRCTPYGLFAGCALGMVDGTTRITLALPANHKKHCRLDMNYVAELAAMIEAKRTGKKLPKTAAPKPREKAVNLASLLKRSLEQEGRQAAKRTWKAA